MIDDMVALLKEEQRDDDDKKEVCEKQIDTAEDKVKVLQNNIKDLETSVEQKTQAIAALVEEIKDLDKSVTEATEQRKAENMEYTELMSSDQAAQEILQFARNRLNKFYNPKLYRAPPKK